MTFAELLREISWPELRSALLWCYPDTEDSLDAYRNAFCELKRLKAAQCEMRIVLEAVREHGEDGESEYTSVSGRNGTLNRELDDFAYSDQDTESEFALSEATFGLSFNRWDEWLGMPIDPSALVRYTPPHLVAHILWEMTFHGFEQPQIAEVLDELKKRVEETDAMSEEARAKHIVSAHNAPAALRRRLE